MRIIDRQKSKYEAPALEKELTDLLDKLLQFDGDVANAEANFNKAVADQQVQVDTYQASIKKITEEGYAQHTSSGRSGSYVPKGAAKQAIEAAQGGIPANAGRQPTRRR